MCPLLVAGPLTAAGLTWKRGRFRATVPGLVRWPSRINLSVLVCNWGSIVPDLFTHCQNTVHCGSANSEAQGRLVDGSGAAPAFKGSQSSLGLSLMISSLKTEAQEPWSLEEGTVGLGKVWEDTAQPVRMSRTWPGRGVRGGWEGVPGARPCVCKGPVELRVRRAGQPGARRNVG